MLTIEQALLCVTGWTRGIERAPNGDLMLVHSAGYWHVSFAQPRLYFTKGREKSGKQKVGPSTMMRPPGDGR